MREILIDIGRLVRRLNRSTPTGVDRVVLAYERELRARFGERVVCVDTFAGRTIRYRPAFARSVLDATASRWRNGGHGPAPSRQRAIAEGIAGALFSPASREKRKHPPLFLCLDHRGLMPGGTVERLSRSGEAECVCLLHDLIPLTHPEYVVPVQVGRHAARITTMSRHAKLVIANSQDTADHFHRELQALDLETPEILVSHLGIETHAPSSRSTSDSGPSGKRPYFVVLGTIEARKNHLLLLNLWRDMVQSAGEEAFGRVPELVIVGRRGWEAEAVFDMLDRCPSLKGHVRELSDMPDTELTTLIDDARALLFPSFTEGFGLPLAEAMARGVPAIASDIGAFREIGGGAPELLSPLDGPAWREAIQDYAAPGSARRTAQVERLTDYGPPDWSSHMDAVCARLEID
ncbi:MAG: glycosyl transferase [Stappia sp.]|uniref:glycosyltransferase family 4 protein n=1 Tax=Stappia sp. TaxID=1870903 RepID=UPI000C54BB57|nr:glycosyltransferase family 1 protein [Stappia sp.]MAA97746.1 glycosyl transferase [Stappia sp.]MBM20637.1 glycosyl transferase [Stappia sp.]